MMKQMDEPGLTRTKAGRGRRPVLHAALMLICVPGLCAWAQGAAASGAQLVTKTFYLTNVNQQSEALDFATTLRNLLQPTDKVYVVVSQNAIVVQGAPEEITLAEKLLHDLDRPKKTYRLTYTLVNSENGKRVGLQHFSMVVVTGQRTVLKEGSRVPLVTGSVEGGSSVQRSITYIDVGQNCDASLDESANGVRLRTKVELSTVAEEVSGLGPQDPVVRQTLLEGTAFLTVGKPLLLGSIDVPGSTRHLDVEVLMEYVAP